MDEKRHEGRVIDRRAEMRVHMDEWIAAIDACLAEFEEPTVIEVEP